MNHCITAIVRYNIEYLLLFCLQDIRYDRYELHQLKDQESDEAENKIVFIL